MALPDRARGDIERVPVVVLVPDSISSDATILVLGRQGYETAVRGKNGFVCMVERSWMEAFDSPEFWNPKVKGAECLNRQAARSILPIADLRTRMVMAGHSKAEIVSAVKAAFDNKQLPDLENGNMVFMMSKASSAVHILTCSRVALREQSA